MQSSVVVQRSESQNQLSNYDLYLILDCCSLNWLISEYHISHVTIRISSHVATALHTPPLTHPASDTLCLLLLYHTNNRSYHLTERDDLRCVRHHHPHLSADTPSWRPPTLVHLQPRPLSPPHCRSPPKSSPVRHSLHCHAPIVGVYSVPVPSPPTLLTPSTRPSPPLPSPSSPHAQNQRPPHSSSPPSTARPAAVTPARTPNAATVPTSTSCTSAQSTLNTTTTLY